VVARCDQCIIDLGHDSPVPVSHGPGAAFGATDYMALVCVFMYGGNDHANTVVHCDRARHQRYSTMRASLAVPRVSLGSMTWASCAEQAERCGSHCLRVRHLARTW